MINAGKNKGKEGVVLQVFPDIQKVIVEGLNKAKRHLKSKGQDQVGQTIDFPAPIHVSNVKIISPKNGKTGRIGYKFVKKEGEKQKKIRVIRSKGKSEDIE